MRPIVIIPARMRSARLPGKPLADIAGKPLVIHVADRARAANLGPVVVATEDAQIVAAVERAGFPAVLTRAHRSGSDRVDEAADSVDPDGQFDVVVNLQGDEPEIEPDALRAVMGPLADPAVDIATLAAPLLPSEHGDPDAVKAHGTVSASRHIRVHSFTRAAPPVGPTPTVWRHVGVYAFRRAALQRFVALPSSASETREHLEQLRALDAGMRIDAALVEAAPRGVDTPADLAAVRDRFARRRLA